MDTAHYAKGIAAKDLRIFLGFWKLGSGGGLITGFTALYRNSVTRGDRPPYPYPAIQWKLFDLIVKTN